MNASNTIKHHLGPIVPIVRGIILLLLFPIILLREKVFTDKKLTNKHRCKINTFFAVRSES